MTVDTDKLVAVDSALLEASKPIANLLAMTLTTASDVIALKNQARVASLNPSESFFKIGTSSGNAIVNVTGGSFLSLSNGSLLQVLGDFLSMSSGSQLNVSSSTGYFARLMGGSVLDVHGALVNFSGTSNQINLAANVAPNYTHSTSGLTFKITGITDLMVLADFIAKNIIVEGTPIKNLAGNSFAALHSTTTSIFEVDGSNPNTKVIIRGR